jgi:hypothetical protein
LSFSTVIEATLKREIDKSQSCKLDSDLFVRASISKLIGMLCFVIVIHSMKIAEQRKVSLLAEQPF